MNSYLSDKGIQASIVTMGVLATLSAVAYSPPLLAVWVAWAGVTGWAVWTARSKRSAA